MEAPNIYQTTVQSQTNVVTPISSSTHYDLNKSN